MSPSHSHTEPRLTKRSHLNTPGGDRHNPAAALLSRPRGAKVSLQLISSGSIQQTSSILESGDGTNGGFFTISYIRGDEDEAEGERCGGARRDLNKSHRCCDPRPNQCKTVETRARGREKGGVRARAKPSGKCRTIIARRRTCVTYFQLSILSS